MSHVTCVNKSCRIWISLVSHINESRPCYMCRTTSVETWMQSRITYINESRDVWISRVTFEWVTSCLCAQNNGNWNGDPKLRSSRGTRYAPLSWSYSHCSSWYDMSHVAHTQRVIWWKELCHTFQVAHEMSHVAHMKWGMSHIWSHTCEMNHVTHVNWGMSYVWSHTYEVTHMKSHIWSHTYERNHVTHIKWGMSHGPSHTLEMSHVTHMNRGMSHIWSHTYETSHVTHMKAHI